MNKPYLNGFEENSFIILIAVFVMFLFYYVNKYFYFDASFSIAKLQLLFDMETTL